MYFILNVCYIPFIPLSSKSSAEEMEEMSFFHFLPPVRKKVISSGRNSTLDSTITVVSSANKIDVKDSEMLDKSLIYSINSKGPSIDP